MSSSIARPFPGFSRAGDDPGVEVPARTQQERTESLQAQEEATDEELMIRLQEGSLDALSSLYRRYARLVMTICLRILRDLSEAEDLVQDIFVFIHRKRGLFDPSKGSARSWLVQVTYHQAFNRRDYLKARRYYTRAILEDSTAEVVPALFANGNGSGEMLYWSSRLERAFDGLSHEQNRALKLYYFEGYTVEEIGERLGLSRGNVRNHLYRGLERLRRTLFSGDLPRKVHPQPCRGQGEYSAG